MKRFAILTILFTLLTANAFAQDKQFLYIEFSPADATLEIDGVVQKTENGVFEKLVPLGQHTCILEKEGYQSCGIVVDMHDPNRTHRLTLKIDPIPVYGSLIIKSTPSNQRIFIDGKYEGSTPKYIPQMLVGQHKIEVTGTEHVVNIMEGVESELHVKQALVDPASVEEDPISFQLVDEKPSFQGGDAFNFSKWVNQNLVYPKNAKENGVHGRVTLQFTVQKDGSVTNVKVLRGIDPALDKEAVRVVSMSPKWTPGRENGRVVPVYYTFPVIFQLR